MVDSRSLCVVMLCVIALDLVLIIVPVAQYPAVLHQQRAELLVVEPILVLLIYGALVVPVTRRVGRNATGWGLLSGVISAAHILQENYVHGSTRTTVALTWVFIIGMFLPWVAAGYQARSVLAGVWSAMVCMLLTVTLGWSELLWALPHAVARNIGSPDFARSGWTDLRAFAIVDLFQAGFWHLVLGPCIAAGLAGVGVLARYVKLWTVIDSEAMARPTQNDVATNLKTFARILRGVAASADTGSTFTEDVQDIADDAEEFAHTLAGNKESAAVETPEELFGLADRAQHVRTKFSAESSDPNSATALKIQAAVEGLKAFIITHRVIKMRNGTHQWAE
jgi:hypothetical protein